MALAEQDFSDDAADVAGPSSDCDAHVCTTPRVR
jgi:hypothetical protein